MGQISQYKFELVEIAKILLEKSGITEGKWTVGFAFNVTGAEAGPTLETTRPSMVISVDKLLLTAATVDGPLVVDAAKLALMPKAG